MSLLTFFVGFLARPFGGALFGHLGDRIGRKSTLIATLLLMGISTLLIGFLPDYAAIGIAAPIIALLLLNGKTSLAALGLSKVTLSIGVAGSWQAVSIYIIVLAVISFVSVLGLREVTRADISSPDAYKITGAEVVLAAQD